MSKQIPYLFDSIISSPLQQVSEKIPNTGRARVRAFCKYGNRNGSYITDQVADQLIESTITKHIPVVGFFDPQTQTWASHTGPTLASAYGYVEDFLGWEPVEDTDGVVRDYAVFSIVLHTDYFEEANQIIGENHSMELNPRTIQGDWIDIDGAEYFVYSFAEMLGFCVIGSHEPCFSASAFFSKNEENKTQFEQFFSLLFELQTKVKEAENNKEGGEQPMEDNANLEVVETSEQEVAEETTTTEFEETPVVSAVEETPEEVVAPAIEETSVVENEAEAVFTENTNSAYDELKVEYEAIQSQLSEANQKIADFEQKLEEANTKYNELENKLSAAQATISEYQNKELEFENSKKDSLIQKYEKVLSAEEISPIKDTIADFSYSELESKLALIHSRKNLTETKKVPIPEIQESEFAKIIKNYRK